MLLNIIAVLAWIAIIGRAVTNAYDWGERVAYFFGSLIFGGIGIFLAWFLLVGIVGGSLPKDPIYKRVDLLNVNDSTSQQGSFFIGIGSFEEEGKFFYYARENGASRFKNIEAENAEIHEDSSKPYALEREHCKGRFDWIAPCVYFSDYVDFHIPAGTIKTNYELDAR